MSQHLRNVARRDAIAAFRSLGFDFDDRRGKGSHSLIYHPMDGERKAFIPRRDPVAIGTLQRILRELRVSMAEFKEALGR